MKPLPIARISCNKGCECYAGNACPKDPVAVATVVAARNLDDRNTPKQKAEIHLPRMGCTAMLHDNDNVLDFTLASARLASLSVVRDETILAAKAYRTSQVLFHQSTTPAPRTVFSKVTDMRCSKPQEKVQPQQEVEQAQEQAQGQPQQVQQPLKRARAKAQHKPMKNLKQAKRRH